MSDRLVQSLAILNAMGDVVRAARKVDDHRDHHPTHLGECIGVLSEPSCTCGLADLHFALKRLETAP